VFSGTSIALIECNSKNGDMAVYRIRWASKGGKVFIFGGSYNTRKKAEAEIPKEKSDFPGISASDDSIEARLFKSS
jgi:hypothetical protein